MSCVEKTGDSRSNVIRELATGIRQLERSRLRIDREEVPVVSTGIESVDALLPHRGLLRGTLSEWISSEAGSGALTLAALAAREAQRTGPVLVIDPDRSFYPPAVRLLGLDLAEMVVIRPPARRDALRTLEQSLRCRGIGAVLALVEQVSAREFRRFQLAAESANSLGFVIRPQFPWKQTRWKQVRIKQSGWGDLRFHVQPLPLANHAYARRIQVTVIHTKGCFCEAVIVLEVCDETGAVRLVSEFPTATTPVQAAGA